MYCPILSLLSSNLLAENGSSLKFKIILEKLCIIQINQYSEHKGFVYKANTFSIRKGKRLHTHSLLIKGAS